MSTLRQSGPRPVVGVVVAALAAVGCVFGVTICIEGAPPDQPGATANSAARLAPPVTGTTHGPPHRRTDRPLPVATAVKAISSEQVSPPDTYGTLIVGGAYSTPSSKPAMASGATALSTATSAGTCVFDQDCDDCNPCTLDECRAPVCTHTSRDTCTACNDGVFCNGVELCNDFGMCRPAAHTACGPLVGTICDEFGGPTGLGECVTPCRTDFDCDDGIDCTGTETCVLRECLGGDNAGAPCSDDTTCTGVGGFCGGVCRRGGYPCGGPTGCTEPVFCSAGTCDGVSGLCVGGFNNGRSCVNPACTLRGRCCKPDGSGDFTVCSRKTKPDCDFIGGRWLNVGDNPATVPDESICTAPAPPSASNAGEDFQCPTYTSGIAPQGEFVAIVGPVGAAVCNALHELGDDYAITGQPSTGFLQVTTVRFAGAFQAENVQGDPSRVRITFYDEGGRFVTDAVANPFGDNRLQIHTVVFAPQPVVPARGWVTLQAWAPGSPFSRHFWASTDAVDTGGNDATMLWVNGGPVPASAVLGPGMPGILAFEIVGDVTGDPSGACCGGSGATGVCAEELPWICRERGGTYLGDGTHCQACANNPFQTCAVAADCPACVGGLSDGFPCDTNAECPGGACANGTCVGGTNDTFPCDPNVDCGVIGACTGTAACLEVPPSCTSTACCNQTTGGCTQVSGAACSDTGASCLRDSDCTGPGATCRPPCPIGTTSQGFGTSCDSNCCEQPIAAGWDTCALADDPGNLAVLAVPPPGSPPITYTFSGDNRAATFDDFGIGGSGTCGMEIFNPEGELRDRGWWHAFRIDACAMVQIDFCCTATRTGTTMGLLWSHLWAECDPCGTTIAETPEAWGFFRPSLERPFCRDSNRDGLKHGPLPPGTYYYPIFSGEGARRDQYQLHIAVSACPTSACCMADDTCQELDHLACETAGGHWTGEAFSTTEGWALSLLSCKPGLCDVGACCVGLGSCVDDQGLPGAPCTPSNPTSCVTRAVCDGLGGTFTGGARCDNADVPCPTCGVIGDSNCQLGTAPTDGLGYMSDLSAYGNGIVSADDFIPFGDTLSSLCVWGTYLDPTAPSPPGPSFGEEYNCTGLVADHFRVRVFRDDGGLPGVMIGESQVTGMNIAFAEEATEKTPQFFGRYTIPFQVHTLTLDTPITGLSPGAVHWLEVTNATFTPEGNQCAWHWAQHIPNDRDAYCASGISPGASVSNVLNGDSVYVPGSERGGVDLAFCLQGPDGPLSFQAPDAPLGCCWQCDGVTKSRTTLRDCMTPSRFNHGVWNGRDPLCTDPWPPLLPNDNCALVPVASSLSSAGVCGNGIVEPGEQCDDGNTLPSDGCDQNCQLECFPPVPCGICVPGPPGVAAGFFKFDNACATNDGPLVVAGDLGNIAFDGDLWYEYRATCTGFLVADMCATQTGFTQDGFNAIDGAIALYHDVDDPFNCPCPGTTIGISPLQFGLGGDENCNGISDAGGGVVRRITLHGECWLIRIGGFLSQNADFGTGSRGRGTLSIACEPTACIPSSAPVPMTVQKPNGALVALRNNRFLSFQGGDAGRPQAVRVTFVSLPGSFGVFNGQTAWVALPQPASELPGKAITDPVGTDPGFMAASLSDVPLYADWSSFGVVHVYDERIIPSRQRSGQPIEPAVYDIQFVSETCDLGSESGFSPALSITNARWADLAQLTSGKFLAPDGIVAIDDTLAILAKFGNASGAPIKARAELLGVDASGTVSAVDGKITVSDLLAVLNAFGGGPYPFPPPIP